MESDSVIDEGLDYRNVPVPEEDDSHSDSYADSSDERIWVVDESGRPALVPRDVSAQVFIRQETVLREFAAARERNTPTVTTPGVVNETITAAEGGDNLSDMVSESSEGRIFEMGETGQIQGTRFRNIAGD